MTMVHRRRRFVTAVILLIVILFVALLKEQDVLLLSGAPTLQTPIHHQTSTFRLALSSQDRIILEQNGAIVTSLPVDDSPACRPRFPANLGKIKRLYFAHTRKAGGTTLRHFFQQVAQLHDWEFVANEGDPAEDPSRILTMASEEEQEQHRHNTIYVTNLRHPVSRALSQYKYEGRWNCKQLLQNKTLFVPTAENSRSLEEFMRTELTDRVKIQIMCHPRKPPLERWLWHCARNCYLRWYGDDFNCLQNATNNYETALRHLSSYHLIVSSERLVDEEYIRGLQQMFGITTNALEERAPMHCNNVSRFWNAQYPAVLNPETLEELHQNNALDIQLFWKLMACPKGITFPKWEDVTTDD